MRVDRRWFVAMAILFLPLLAGNAYGDSRYRWDFPVFTSPHGVVTVSAGNTASALAQDGSKITLTGHGTFTVGDEDVTGGGTWKTVAADGTADSGTFVVTGLIRFVLAPGSLHNLPFPVNDTIGDVTKTHAGLVHLRVDYVNAQGLHSKGILIISCAAPGAPSTIFEGITASKGFVDYWNRLPPDESSIIGSPNFTLFHLLSEEED